MRRWDRLAGAALLALTMPWLRAGGGARVEMVDVASEALGRSLPLAIIRPDDAGARGAASPVLYLLHGRGRHHASLLERPVARAALLRSGFTLVLPQGEDGWYVDSPRLPAERYGTYLGEVIAWVENHLPVRRDPAGRGVAGWSMGGYGAVRYAASHPGEFAFVGSIIGLLDFPRAETLPEGQNYSVPRERFGDDEEVWRALNPLTAVAALRDSRVTLVLAEEGFERSMNERFVAAAHAAGVPVRVHWLPGGHQIEVVERALPLLLDDAAAAFGVGAAPGSEPSAPERQW